MQVRHPLGAVRVFLCALLLAALGANPLGAQTAPKVLDVGIAKPASVIYIGNSFFYYNNGINGLVTQLMASADPAYKLRSTMVTISGSGMNWHDVDSYFRPEAIGSYSFDAANNVVFNKLDKLFDVAIIMDCSQCPIHPTLKSVFREYAKKNSDAVRKHGATPVFFMSWAYADKPEMTKELAEAYIQAGNEHNALVIPAGIAFARSIAQRPDINLYVADKRHPTLAGSYLAACTTLAAVFGKSPVGLKYTAGLDDATARHLQTVAWTTVQEFFKP